MRTGEEVWSQPIRRRRMGGHSIRAVTCIGEFLDLRGHFEGSALCVSERQFGPNGGRQNSRQRTVTNSGGCARITVR
jgi:hypothetical protein